MSCLKIKGPMLDIDHFLRTACYPADFEIFMAEGGRPLSPHEALSSLFLLKLTGRKFLPMSERCGAPCKQRGCTGFEAKGVGCPGYSLDFLPPT